MNPGDIVTDLFGTKIITASVNETANDILERAGINVIRGKDQTYFYYNHKGVARPMINNWEKLVLDEFNILIQYTDKVENL